MWRAFEEQVGIMRPSSMRSSSAMRGWLARFLPSTLGKRAYASGEVGTSPARNQSSGLSAEFGYNADHQHQMTRDRRLGFRACMPVVEWPLHRMSILDGQSRHAAQSGVHRDALGDNPVGLWVRGWDRRRASPERLRDEG